MSRFFPDDVPPIVNHAIARVERHLPHPGEILVRVGSRVEPDDVIARSVSTGKREVLNVAGTLAIQPRDIRGAMRKEEGNKVAAGEIIARTGLVGRRSCLSPVNGTLTHIDSATGYVVIEPDPEPLEIRAQVRGLVMEVAANGQSIVIETPASTVHGIAGVGPDRFGVLRLLVTDPAEVVDVEMIDARSAYAIVIAGAGITAAALERAIQEQVRAVIVGGMEASELMKFLGEHGDGLWQIGRESWDFPNPAAIDPGLTLVITEGFGIRPMSRPIFELLSAYDQQEALIQGGTRIRGPVVRPRLVIPLTRARTASEEASQHGLRVGATARLLSEQHLGQVGKLVMLPAEPEILPSGARGLTAHVDLPDGQRIVVARSAVEALA